MGIPPITRYQKRIPFLLYKFRYLTVGQFQKLLNHKDSHRIKVWLKYLNDTGYIAVIKSTDVTAPYIYCLDTKSKYVLQEDTNCDHLVLARLYKEKDNKIFFIYHLVSIATAYLFFLSQKENRASLQFFTRQDLIGYDYFPKDFPDAYIVIKSGKRTNRYFLDVFDPDTPAYILRKRIRDYIRFAQDGSWQANTDNSQFPANLFVCPNERLKKHIYLYSKSRLERSISNDIDLFLTTKDRIESNKGSQNIWEKVEVTE